MRLLREETIAAPQWVWLVAFVFCLSWILVTGIALFPQPVSGSTPLIAESLPSFLFMIQFRQALILLAWLCHGLVQAELKRSLLAIVNKAEVLIAQLVRMKILMWNCRGALNPEFKRRVCELVANHCPSIMVITETRVGGERAKKIIEGLPFDGFITTDTIGYAGGLWILWNKEGAEISLLANTEQEIHATLKCLCYATELDLPLFHNLALLNFDIGGCLWHVLSHLLHRAPNLAVLLFEKEYAEFYVCDEEDTSIIEWMSYEDVPICISLHLKTFHFIGFKGLTYELEFDGHILVTARFLKTMTVSSADIDSEEKFRVLKELFMLPRESRTCQIAFS